MSGGVRMQFGTGTTVKDFTSYREWLRVAEGAGFDLLTTGDSQSLWADPFVSMTVAAMSTTEPRLAITVSNPVTRHPAVTASAAAAIQQLSGNRFVYGISSGDSALRNIGASPATVEDLGEYVRAVQGMCSSKPASWHGSDLELRWDISSVPVWMAVEGPRTQRLAGAIADGVVLSNCLTRGAIERAMANVAAGAQDAGRAVADIEVWWMANLVPAASEADGIRSIRAILAGTANHVFRFTTEGKGAPEELIPRIEELMQCYDSRHHANPETALANAELIDRLGLTDWLANQSTIAGPIEHCIERLHEVREAGATRLILSQFVPDQIAFMETFAATIAPEFK